MACFFSLVWLEVWLVLIVRTGAATNNILITGGAGFIGFHTALKLTEDSHNKIVVLDIFDESYDTGLKKARADLLKKKDVTVHYGDVCRQQLLDHLFEKHKFDYVVHMAAKDGYSDSMKDPNAFVKANTECLLQLLNVLRSYKSTHLVYASSYNVLDEKKKGLTPSISLYTALKSGAEILVSAYCHEYGISAVGVRPFSVYGPWSKPSGDIHRMALQMNGGKDAEVYLSEKTSTVASRDYTYVDDVVSGVVAAMNYRPDECGKVFNLGSGVEPISMETVFSLLKKEMEVKSKKVTKAVPVYEPLTTHADISVTEQDLKYTPQTSIEDGIKKFVQWFREYHNKKQSPSEPDHSLVDQLDKKDEKILYKNKKYHERIVEIRKEYEKKAIENKLPLTKYYPKEFKKFENVVSTTPVRTQIKDKSVSILTDWCTIIDECVAFDTRGYLYSYIQQKSHWKHAPGVNLYAADLDVCKAGLLPCYGNCTCTYKGPSQFEATCAKGFGLVDQGSLQYYCYELYVPGKPAAKEEEFRLMDKVDNRDWNALVKGKGYNKFSNKYIRYGVISYYPDAAGNVDKLKEACDHTYHCIGFTTNGELKGIIDHVHRWTKSSHDMYLKDIDYCSMHEEKCKCKRLAPGNYSCLGKKP